VVGLLINSSRSSIRLGSLVTVFFCGFGGAWACAATGGLTAIGSIGLVTIGFSLAFMGAKTVLIVDDGLFIWMSFGDREKFLRTMALQSCRLNTLTWHQFSLGSQNRKKSITSYNTHSLKQDSQPYRLQFFEDIEQVVTAILRKSWKPALEQSGSFSCQVICHNIQSVGGNRPLTRQPAGNRSRGPAVAQQPGEALGLQQPE
jgi:hypothetical protein